MKVQRALRFGLFSSLLLAFAPSARAQPLIAVEAAGAAPVTKPQSQLFSLGGAASAAGYARIAPALLVGARLRLGLLSNGDSPVDSARVDPNVGTFETLAAMVRLRPLAKSSEARSALGPFIEGGGGGILTGKLLRPGFEAGLGWGFAIGSLALAPTLRYLQVVQGHSPLAGAGSDARLVMIGAELSVLDSKPKAAISEPVPETPLEPAAPPDADDDGVPDATDQCPNKAEDRDGFQDDDGCPDDDNDGDKVPDESDKCPNDPEDIDGFEDADGCPDPDNDHDTFLDADDQCPNEAEVINGNKDYDGCPDEGLIEMHNDRIVLEEQVLFDFERARVKSAARPVLAAIMSLYKQHPEWLQIRIEGHADQRGKEEYNQELSEERARNVRDELIKLGIPADKIESVGYGSTRPRDLRPEEASYQRNRRVEFVVLASTGPLPGPEAKKAKPLGKQAADPAAKPAPATKPEPVAKPAAKPATKPAAAMPAAPKPAAKPGPAPKPAPSPEEGEL
jgi:outer membrane protein OmpA-like peptidoglycan-associated protein